MPLPKVTVPKTIIYIHDDGTKDIFLRHEEIGYGGFAVVYIVTHQNTNKNYAMKVISKQHLSTKGQTALKMLQNEMKIQKSLNHPNIVRAKYSFSDESNYYIVLEYCPGKSIRDFLRNSSTGRLSEPETRKILRDVIRGLAYLHNKDIIHHDIKLENFLIGSDGKVKIADFGLSTILKNEDEEEKSFVICGTTNYFCPEIIQKEGIGFGVDIWAVGVAAFIMLTSNPPFEGSRKEITYENIKNCDYNFPSKIFISSDAKDFIKAVLQIDPHKRPTAIELLNHPFLTQTDTERIQLYNPLQSFQKSQPTIQNTQSTQKVQPAQKTDNEQNASVSPSKFTVSQNSNQNLEINSISNLNHSRTNLTNTSLRTSSIYNPTISTQTSDKYDIKKRASRPSKSRHSSVCNLKRQSNFTIPSYFVTKYCFHGEDMIYILGNGTVGVCFKDQSRIIIDPNQEFIHYYEDYDSTADIFYIHDYINKINEDIKDRLQSKISLVKKYAKSFKKDPTLYSNDHHPYDSVVPLHHVKYFVCNKNSILFKMNDKNIQTIFLDQKQLFIFLSTKKMCLARDINEKCRLLDFHYVASMGSECDELRKFKMAKVMLSLLSKKIRNVQI